MIKRKKSFLWRGLFFIYFIILFRITIFRSGFSFFRIFENGSIQFMPFIDLFSILKESGWFTFGYLFFGNLIWFIPLGIFLYSYMPGICYRKVALYGFCFSFFIEAAQFIFGTGVSEIDDLILNTIGALLGAFFAQFYSKIKRRK